MVDTLTLAAAWLIRKETREMVQCDQCSLWQHIPCLKIPRNDIPLDYVRTHLYQAVPLVVSNLPSFVTIVCQRDMVTYSFLQPNPSARASRQAKDLGRMLSNGQQSGRRLAAEERA